MLKGVSIVVIAAQVAVFLLAVQSTTAAPATTEVISPAVFGEHQDESSEYPSMSADGRLVAFESRASNLIFGDTNNAWDVFVRDRVTKRTFVISLAPDGAPANGDSRQPAISSDGRYVAFLSNATNLTDRVTAGQSLVYVHDLTSGRNSLVSAAANGDAASANCDLGYGSPAISADGRWIAFGCAATNLVADGKGAGMFLHDRASNQTIRASVRPDGTPVEDPTSAYAAISPDGRYVAFQTREALAPDDTEGFTDVYVFDRETKQSVRASVATDGAPGNFHSGDSAAGFGPGPAISADGRYVAFPSAANNLVLGDTNDKDDIFLRDLRENRTTRISVATDGSQANHDSTGQGGGKPSFSANGRYLAFTSYAKNLVQGLPADVNSYVFLRDLVANETTLISLSASNEIPLGPAYSPSLSADGRYVAYAGYGSSIVSERIEFHNVFVRDQGGPEVAVVTAPVGPAGARVDAGGGITAEGGVTILFPPGAVASPASATVMVNPFAAPAGVAVQGGQLLPVTVDITLDPPVPLSKAVEVLVNIPKEALGDRDLASIRGGVVQGATVEPFPTRVVDPANRVIGISAEHFTKFTLFQFQPAFVGPVLTQPAQNSTLSSLGTTLTWSNPPGATQYQLQVIPFHGDGPGINIIRNIETSFTIPSPPNWYGLLPDMNYVWRVRTSNSPTTATEGDWLAWSVASFRTPLKTSDTLTLVSPALNQTVTSLTPVLTWANTDSETFYYEVQVSKDPTFTTDPARATAVVYYELRHGGVTQPPNSYAIASGFPLEPATQYFWRVRPRVQGDGTPVAWGPSWSFKAP